MIGRYRETGIAALFSIYRFLRICYLFLIGGGFGTVGWGDGRILLAEVLKQQYALAHRPTLIFVPLLDHDHSRHQRP